MRKNHTYSSSLLDCLALPVRVTRLPGIASAFHSTAQPRLPSPPCPCPLYFMSLGTTWLVALADCFCLLGQCSVAALWLTSNGETRTLFSKMQELGLSLLAMCFKSTLGCAIHPIVEHAWLGLVCLFCFSTLGCAVHDNNCCTTKIDQWVT